MNVEESILYLREEHKELLDDYGSIDIESFFFCFDDETVKASGFLLLLNEVRDNVLNKKEIIISAKSFDIIEEAKRHLSDDSYCLCYLDWIEYFFDKDYGKFVKSLDRAIDCFFSNKEAQYSISNLSYLLTLSKKILCNDVSHFITIIKNYILSSAPSIYFVYLVKDIINIFGDKESKKHDNLRICLSHLAVMPVEKNIDGTCVLQLIEDWKRLFTNDSRIAKQKYIDIVLDNYVPSEYQGIQIYLQRCRDYIGSTRYRTDELKKLDDEIKRLGKKALDSMQEVSINLPQEQQEIINQQIESMIGWLKKETNLNKIFWLLSCVGPIKKETLINCDNEAKRKSVFSRLVNEQVYDSQGEIKNYKEMTEDEKDSLRIHSAFGIHLQVELIYFHCFYETFCIDTEVKDYIKQVASHNMMINEKWEDSFASMFTDFLDGKYSEIINNVIPMFEDCLRFYLNNEGLYVRKINSGDYINCNDIFNNEKDNQYRDKLYETIDEDYYYILTWLLTDKFGYNLRNKDMHGINNPQLKQSADIMYVEYLIFRLFFAFVK